ncbi:tetratricopeptide repeat protein [bacterium]|nr:tetratricopeptide repeat protein [bacterium]
MNKIEELVKELGTAVGEKKFDILRKLSMEYANKSPSKAVEYGLMAYDEAKKLGNKEHQISSLINVGNGYFNSSNFQKTQQFLEKALKLTKYESDEKFKSNILNNLGLVKWRQDKYDEALKYIFKSLEIREKIKAQNEKESKEKKERIAQCYDNLGIIYYSLKNYEKALEYFKKSLEMKKSLKNTEQVSLTLNNIGAILRETQKHDEALKYLTESLELKEKSNDKVGIVNTLMNIGSIYAESKNSQKALEYFDKIVDICDSTGNKTALAMTMIEIARVKIEQNKINEAIEFLEKSLAIGEETDAPNIIRINFEQLSKIYEKNNDFENSLKYFKKSIEAKDKIFQEETNKAIAEMEIKYETEKKEHELEISNLKYVQLKQTNEELVETQKILQEYRDNLEQLVQKRSQELVETNKSLQKEVEERKRAEISLSQSYEKLRQTFDAIIKTMTKVVEFRDPYTAGHQERVSKLAVAIARQMGFDEHTIEGIRLAGMVHDIGKIYVPAEILTKPGKLSSVEFMLIKNHSSAGYEILKSIEFPWDIAQIVRQHHERLDGSGYPDNLKDDEILLESKIIAVADVVEAISSYRPYRPALGIDIALDEIEKNSGKLYDKDIVDACLKIFNENKFEWE